MNFKPKKQQLLNLLPNALVMTRGKRQGTTRYLTFDDGPDPKYTPQLLDLLAKLGIRASFFVIGDKVEKHPAIVRRIVAEGHMLGNHSYSHWSFKPMSLRQQLAEINRTDALLREFDPRPHHRTRTPRGDLAPSLLLYFAAHRRSFVYWSYDSMDYQDAPQETLVQRLLDSPPQPGDIVLMHDDNTRSIGALEIVLPQWLASGYTFEPLPAQA
jgi:peptidoglycan/xylan/chitin deacetylase (PgdA/CDA1 family)